MKSDHNEPVLIVGAGPTGMVLANELLRRGVPCRMIDKKSGPTETSRSFTLHAKTMEMFEHMGLAHRFLADGLKSRGFYFNFKGKDTHPTLDFTQLDSTYPYILVYNQNETEQRLREHLDSTYGLRPEWEVELVEFEQGEDRYRAVLKGGDGQEQTVSPRWIVGCDGIHSFVRQSAGLDFVGENYEGMIMQMMDVEYDGFEGDDDWVHYYMSKDSFLLLTRLPDGNHRVLISDMGEADDPDLSQRDAFQRLIDGHVSGTTLSEPQWGTKWQIWKRLATAYSKGNLFLAGDAAHVHSPSGGQGMNAGMQDAFNLGWKLALVEKGQARRSLLDTYGVERAPIGAQVIAGTDAMHDIIMAHGHGMDDRLQLTRQDGWHSDTVNRISGLSYTYRDVVDVPENLNPLAGPACGDRAPDVALGNDQRLFDILRSSRLALLLVAGRPETDQALSDVWTQINSKYSELVRTVVLSERHHDSFGKYDQVLGNTSQYCDVYGEADAGQILLLRPDGYIAFRCELGESDQLFTYLTHWYH